MINEPIAVSSSSFSQNETLRQELLTQFSNVTFNSAGIKFTTESLSTYLQNSTGLIVGLEQINTQLFKLSPKLKKISKYGVGIDNINFNDCKTAGVRVLHSPGVNAFSVAEQTLAFMIMLSRNLYTGSNGLKNGVWNKNGGFSIIGKTIGILGLGNVGKKLVEFLKPFNCKILANDIEDRTQYANENNVRLVDFETLFTQSDFLTIHTPLTSVTSNLVTLKQMNLMKRNSYLINTARGSIVNEQDLIKALNSKLIAGAALDVYSEEPPNNLELLGIHNLITTPHICGNSIESVLAMGRSAIKNLVTLYSS